MQLLRKIQKQGDGYINMYVCVCASFLAHANACEHRIIRVMQCKYSTST